MNTTTAASDDPTTAAAPPSTWSLIRWPAILTLVVTIVRLVGEIQGWSQKYFNSEGGGAGAIVGIVWLVPIFGIWYGRRLESAGQGPTSRARAIGWPLAALLLFVGLVTVIMKKFDPQPGKETAATFIFANQASALLCAAIAWRGWPRLARLNLAYGLAARIPVAFVMLIAMNAKWGTHYEKGVPGLAEHPLVQQWLLIGVLPQMIGWISFTIFAGGLFGGLSLLLGRRQSAARVEPSPAASQAH